MFVLFVFLGVSNGFIYFCLLGILKVERSAVKILEASSDFCHPPKKKNPKEKKIHVLLCSLKSLQSVTLVLFPLNADLYNNEL